MSDRNDVTGEQEPVYAESTSPDISSAGVAAIQGEVQEEWIEHGIIDVPVADLPMPEDVSSPADFNHHITWEDAEHHTKQLPQIQQEMQQGKTREDFVTDDQSRGIYGTERKTGTYDLFYGSSEPVKLNKEGDQYDIISGRHRIYAAKHLGLKTIPADVSEKIQESK